MKSLTGISPLLTEGRISEGYRFSKQDFIKQASDIHSLIVCAHELSSAQEDIEYRVCYLCNIDINDGMDINYNWIKSDHSEQWKG